MNETAITLYIELRQGSRLDLEAAANASLAWAKMVRTIGQNIDPTGEWSLELESSLPGSQKIKSVLKLSSSDKRLIIIASVVSALSFIGQEVLGWGIGQVLDYLKGADAPAETRTLSDEELFLIADRIATALQGNLGAEQAVKVYEALEADPDVTGAGATSGEGGKPTHVVPRAAFPSRREETGTSEPEERTHIERVEIILIRPVLAARTNRRWGFQSKLGAFGAPIHDERFLTELLDGKLNVPLAQGIVMDVDLEISEERIGGVWRPKDRTVKRVHGIKRAPVQTSLFDDKFQQDDTDGDNSSGDD